MATTITIRRRGPVFDGRATRAVDAYIAEAVEVVAEEGVRELRFQLDRVLKNPTGYYRAHTDAEAVGRHNWRIHDHDVIYGPWPAGEGSRNAPVTRFKGYTHWRKTFQWLNRNAKDLAEDVIPPYLRRMN